MDRSQIFLELLTETVKDAPAPMLFNGSARRLRLFSLVRKELRIEKNNFNPLWPELWCRWFKKYLLWFLVSVKGTDTIYVFKIEKSLLLKKLIELNPYFRRCTDPSPFVQNEFSWLQRQIWNRPRVKAPAPVYSL